MCGIAGYILKEPTQGQQDVLLGLLTGVRQRGPDDEGVALISRRRKDFRLFSTEKTVPGACAATDFLSAPVIQHDAAFLHTRYAIIDVSAGGHQPFVSRDGSIVVVFNGEIYNYLELKDELLSEGIDFRTASDTEVLVEGYRLWKDDLWRKMNGFWAAAIYDRRDNRMILSRDRLGVAPLYYRQRSQGLFFASLIQPLVNLAPESCPESEDILRGFLDVGLKDHDNTTVYAEIQSLPAGSFVTFSPDGGTYAEASVKRFWHLPDVPLSEGDLSFDEAARTVRELLFDAVKLRLRADVPLAFELSGGLDSSSVVAAAAELTGRKLTAYTLKVIDKDESPYAISMARHCGFDLRIITDTACDFIAEGEAFAAVMEEPYDTPANYFHHAMLKRIKADGFQSVLTGAGGDETLAGYESAFWPKAYREWRQQSVAAHWQADGYEFSRRFRSTAETAATLRSYSAAFARHIGGVKNYDRRTPAQTSAFSYIEGYSALSFFDQRRFHINVGLLPYYLRSTDHYTMNIPLEHRFPLLDYRLVEFGLRLPISYLFRQGWSKYVLRKAMEKYLPGDVLWRRQKMGFPFAFRKYLSAHFSAFEKYSDEPGLRAFLDNGKENYKALATQDPVRLWRIFSVGMWLRSRRGAA